MVLAEHTAQAIAAGVFGVPTFTLDDELFWGSERSVALIRDLRGQRVGEQALADFLAKNRWRNASVKALADVMT